MTRSQLPVSGAVIRPSRSISPSAVLYRSQAACNRGRVSRPATAAAGRAALQPVHPTAAYGQPHIVKSNISPALLKHCSGTSLQSYGRSPTPAYPANIRPSPPSVQHSAPGPLPAPSPPVPGDWDRPPSGPLVARRSAKIKSRDIMIQNGRVNSEITLV